MDDKKQLSVIVDEKVLKSFDRFCDGIGLSRTAVLTAFMKNCIMTGKLPFTPSVKDRWDEDGNYLYNFDEPMYHIIREVIAKYENGNKG